MSEKLLLQTIEIQLQRVLAALESSDRDAETADRNRELPEWLTLEQAVALKGGAAMATYEQRYWLQPCCGLNSRRVGGRKAWPRALVLEWLPITDDRLNEYAAKFGASIPDKYKGKRA